MGHVIYEDAPKYLYRISKEAQIEVPFKSGLNPGQVVANEFISIEVIDSEAVLLTFKPGYAWDGASGAFNTKSWVIPSLVHDGLYQFFREGLLSRSLRNQADLAMYYLLKQRMVKGNYFSKKWGGVRARLSYVAVREFGGKHTYPKSKNLKKAKIFDNI